jgi:hypothetical protein
VKSGRALAGEQEREMRTGNLWYFVVCEDPKPQETECASPRYSCPSGEGA